MSAASQLDAFGSNFMPGQVEADQTAASHALGSRWSGMPAHGSAADQDEVKLEPFSQQDTNRKA